MTVEAKGFKRAIRENLTLSVQDRLRVSFTLPVGDVQQSVEVMGEAPLLQSETSSLGQVVDTRKMVDLPLNGRNFIQLITLSTGAYVPQTTNSSYQSTLVAINGNRVENNNFMLDGVNNNTTDNNQPPVLPNPDAIAEFKVLTNMLPAEFGRGLGGTVIVNIKSGTNQYHGTAFRVSPQSGFRRQSVFQFRPSQSALSTEPVRVLLRGAGGICPRSTTDGTRPSFSATIRAPAFTRD